MLEEQTLKTPYFVEMFPAFFGDLEFSFSSNSYTQDIQNIFAAVIVMINSSPANNNNSADLPNHTAPYNIKLLSIKAADMARKTFEVWLIFLKVIKTHDFKNFFQELLWAEAKEVKTI